MFATLPSALTRSTWDRKPRPVSPLHVHISPITLRNHRRPRSPPSPTLQRLPKAPRPPRDCYRARAVPGEEEEEEDGEQSSESGSWGSSCRRRRWWRLQRHPGRRRLVPSNVTTLVCWKRVLSGCKRVLSVCKRVLSGWTQVL